MEKIVKIVKMIKKRRILIPCVIFLFLLFFMAIFDNIISPHDPLLMNYEERLEPPGVKNWLGTDDFGRDVLSRIIHGARLTVISGLGVVVISTVLGLIIAVTSAYYKSFGLIMMRFIDILMAFPALIMALALVAILGSGLTNVILAVATSYLCRTTRIIYGLTLGIIEKDYIKAARSAGATNTRIILKHIIPNLVSPLIVQSTFTFAFSLLRIASLDYLGMGAGPNVPSWGNILNESRNFIITAPWLLIFPGLSIVFTVLSLNIVGDALRDQIDPRFRRQISES